ncbi:MAG: methionyl-tRNA formyltransferase [Saprospiraceae bacterium]|nr:methionyl-tRNA formyltransferase [Saprospiraceae bacterium]MDW8483025.1 methionyl-tRNA formyltransferase [Saprospiraceae bacterium]
MRIVFMGTPEFAVPSLQLLWKKGYDISAVVTAPDRPGGRLGLIESAVKKFALKHGLAVLQPEKLKAPEFIEQLRAYRADLQVVVAFRMLPEVVWAMPPLGTVNLHASLLPKYRGAAPIHWAIINGETETGLTTFRIRHAVDTGDILFQERLDIGENETAGELHDRMMHVGAQLVLRTVQAIERGDIHPQPQKEDEATYAPKIFSETCHICFDRPTVQVHNFIRGLSPSPGAWAYLQGKVFKIFRTLKEYTPPSLPPGHIIFPPSGGVWVTTVDGHVQLIEVQLESKRRLSAEEFRNGYQKKIQGAQLT